LPRSLHCGKITQGAGELIDATIQEESTSDMDVATLELSESIQRNAEFGSCR
jgi:hypothetical protein